MSDVEIWTIDSFAVEDITNLERIMTGALSSSVVILRRNCSAGFVSTRLQWNAQEIVKSLLGEEGTSNYRLILTGRDIFAPLFDSIYGYADRKRNGAIVSNYRLKDWRMIERTARELMHELGHLVGFEHCLDSSCVMASSDYPGQVDAKSLYPCKRCLERTSGSRIWREA